MPSWIYGQGQALGVVAAKGALIYLVTVAGLRYSQRRTLAQWTTIDFAAAVAIGAILGRTAVASDQSFAVGAVALVTILAVHWAVTMLRFRPWIGNLIDHRVRVLVDHGRVRTDQLRLCGVTENDLFAQLRQQGVESVESLRYVLYETKGELTIVPEQGARADGDLVRIGLRDAAGYDGHPG